MVMLGFGDILKERAKFLSFFCKDGGYLTNPQWFRTTMYFWVFLLPALGQLGGFCTWDIVCRVVSIHLQLSNQVPHWCWFCILYLFLFNILLLWLLWGFFRFHVYFVINTLLLDIRAGHIWVFYFTFLYLSSSFPSYHFVQIKHYLWQ